MGFLDGLVSNALGGLLGGGSNAAAPAGQQPPQQQQSSLSPILIQLVLQLIQQNGGLPGILARFRQAGLSQQTDSWVSTGNNLPVSDQDVTQALGPDVVNQLAGQSGLDPSQVSQGLTQLLPDLINRMTPDGQVPDNHNDVLTEGLQALLGRSLR